MMVMLEVILQTTMTLTFLKISDVLTGRSVKVETGNKILNMPRQSHRLSDILSGKSIKTNFWGFLWFS